MDSFPAYRIHVITFDTDAYNPAQYDSDNLEDICDYEVTGGGGTDFEANWEFMKEQGIQPKKFIMFTDGYPCGSWGDEDYCDTIFIVKGNTQANAPFGQTVIYEKETGTA